MSDGEAKNILNVEAPKRPEQLRGSSVQVREMLVLDEAAIYRVEEVNELVNQLASAVETANTAIRERDEAVQSMLRDRMELLAQVSAAVEAQQKADRETTRTFKVLRDHGLGLNSGDLENTVRQAVQAAVTHSANTTEAIRQRDEARATIQRHSAVIDNLCEALMPDSPLESARAEFDLDAMGACQIIRRHRELVRYLTLERYKNAADAKFWKSRFEEYVDNFRFHADTTIQRLEADKRKMREALISLRSEQIG